MKVYEVSWSIKLTRYITASSKQEAIDISYEMGDGGLDVDTYDMTPMKARVKRRPQ
tara:strand:- start:4201 stop:4368 length:168 start_codon:yes stop_codon:yes gene_type:complete